MHNKRFTITHTIGHPEAPNTYVVTETPPGRFDNARDALMAVFSHLTSWKPVCAGIQIFFLYSPDASPSFEEYVCAEIVEEPPTNLTLQ